MGRDGDARAAVLPRYVPEVPFPPYTYVPGETPHPIRDPSGHLFGFQAEPIVFSPARWQACREYLRGIDLFNHGYYWEAHEAWEAVWHAAGRSGPTADLMKGLIKLAAAGVKTRAGSAKGRQRHARRAGELFQQVGRHREADAVCARTRMGLSLASLARGAMAAERETPWITASGSQPPRVFSFLLLPERGACFDR